MNELSRESAGKAQNGGSAQKEQAEPSEQVIRETREAGLRAEGGGEADEEEIRKAASES